MRSLFDRSLQFTVTLHILDFYMCDRTAQDPCKFLSIDALNAELEACFIEIKFSQSQASCLQINGTASSGSMEGS